MARRYEKVAAVKSLIVPVCFYITLAFLVGYLFWPYFYYVKNETFIVIGVFAIWRYGWQAIHYIRAAIYRIYLYPKLVSLASALPDNKKYPEHIYFIIPSYNEEPWVSREALHSVFSELGHIPTGATIIVATGSDEDDAIISSIYESHPVKYKVDLILQRQSQGKRIAMGHALRSAARRYNQHANDPNSVTIFMDGDTFLMPGTLQKVLPFFSLLPKLGALTTNEVAFINTESSWYKAWFNLKFGQRHLLFQSHSLSKRVLTLTGRFSTFRSSIVMQEDFIKQIEHDVITHWRHGKFRFLMGDDKSSWYYLLKNGWEMLYLPDVLCYSLESRDADFMNISLSLPYRWYGNTLRNNERALAIGWHKIGLFIWICILDQRISMWTSLVGLTGAIILSIFKSFIYLPLFLSWVCFVRSVQISVIAFMGHPVNLRTIPLMLYNQWIGALIKIHAYFNLSNQKWSKGKSQQQKTDENLPISHPLARWMPTYSMILFYILFCGALLIAEEALKIPNLNFLRSEAHATKYLDNNSDHQAIIPNDNKDDANAINQIIKTYRKADSLTIKLPEGVLDLYSPILIDRDNVTLEGSGTSKTFFKVHITKPYHAAILVKGNRGNRIGYLNSALKSIDSIVNVKLNKKLESGSVLLFLEPNTEKFFDEIKSWRWRRKHPAIRQTLVQVNRPSTKRIVYLTRSIGSFFNPKSTLIFETNPVRNVTMEKFSIQHIIPDHKIDEAQGVYENLFPKYAIDSISFNWATNCSVKDINIINSGSNPIVFENSLRCNAERLRIEGSWNKGTKGSGYIKLSRAYFCRLSELDVKDIRHIVIQWSSSHNVLRNILSEVDINFHGGGEHNNQIINTSIKLPIYHRWEPVVVTGSDSHWAPPTGHHNYYENQLLNLMDGSRG